MRPAPGKEFESRPESRLHKWALLFGKGLPFVPQLYGVCSATASDQGTPTTVLAGALPPNPLKENEQYDKVSDLGAGASAFVVLAEDTVTRQQFAIKFIDRGTTA